MSLNRKKIGFVFSGQGDQYPGMGKDLCEQYKCAAEVFEICDSIRPNTFRQCFTGTQEELKETKNTQPCLFAVEMAYAAVLAEAGIKPDAAAGFSLGEVAACTASGKLDLETGFRLVCKRGELMQQEAEKYDTAMAAVIKLTPETVAELCEKYEQVYPVNYNCPGQISVAGLSEELKKFSADVKNAGGRVILLKVKGAFHSPFMRAASNAFAEELKLVSFQNTEIPLYSNVTADVYGENAVELLSEQIASPVRFEMLIRNMIASGIDTFIEIGPGKTLTNMIKKIDGQVNVYSVSDLPVILAEVKPC